MFRSFVGNLLAFLRDNSITFNHFDSSNRFITQNKYIHNNSALNSHMFLWPLLWKTPPEATSLKLNLKPESVLLNHTVKVNCTCQKSTIWHPYVCKAIFCVYEAFAIFRTSSRRVVRSFICLFVRESRFLSSTLRFQYLQRAHWVQAREKLSQPSSLET